MQQILSKLMGAAVGMVMGVFLSFVITIAFGILIGVAATFLYPNDPSAGSAAEIAILAFPFLALIAGIICGVIGWNLAGRLMKYGA
jgi:hypothetical protein